MVGELIVWVNRWLVPWRGGRVGGCVIRLVGGYRLCCRRSYTGRSGSSDAATSRDGSGTESDSRAGGQCWLDGWVGWISAGWVVEVGVSGSDVWVNM